MTSYKRISFITDCEDSFLLCTHGCVSTKSNTKPIQSIPNITPVAAKANSTQKFNLRTLKPFKDTEFVLPLLEEKMKKTSMCAKYAKAVNMRKHYNRSVCERNYHKEGLKNHTTFVNGSQKMMVVFVRDGIDPEKGFYRVWKCKKDWLFRMQSLSNGEKLAEHYFESLKDMLQKYFNLEHPVTLHKINGERISRFTEIEKVVIVKEVVSAWTGLKVRSKVSEEEIYEVISKGTEQKIVPERIEKPTPRAVSKIDTYKRINLFAEIDKPNYKKQVFKSSELNMKEICDKYHLTYAQFTYLTSKFDILLRIAGEKNESSTIPLTLLVDHKGEVLSNLHPDIRERICIAGRISESVTKAQYIWLHCLLLYNTLPISELVAVWKKILDPKGIEVVPHSELKETLVNISKCSQRVEIDFIRQRFAHSIINELRKSNCLSIENSLIISNFQKELMNETKLLLYLNQSISKSSALRKPLALLWGQVGKALERKHELMQKIWNDS